MNIIKRRIFTRGIEREINNYVIEIDEDMRERCWEFAQTIINTNNQFDRMLPDNITNEEEGILIRIQRTYVGKLAEYAFYKCLVELGKEVELGDMFTIYEGQENVDSYDFITRNQETVDVKAAFRENHRNLVVNIRQLDRISKNYYVGIKLNATDYDRNLINPDSITRAEICGYCEERYLVNKNTVFLGEDNCKAIRLDCLMGIDRLIDRF